MRLAILSDGISSHAQKWVRSLSERGHDVHLISMENMEDPGDVRVHLLPFKRPFGYYLNVGILRRLLKKIQPDLLHVHYASGNGTLGRLANYRPCILSVWGSDVFKFPYQSRSRFNILRRNLEHYDYILSTSSAMADQVTDLYPHLARPTVIPFGVNTAQFRPISPAGKNDFVTVGIIKSLRHSYAIDILLKAFAKASCDDSLKMRLMIVGNGSLKRQFVDLAQSLNIQNLVDFVDRIPHHDVPRYMNRIDIFVNASRSESFGVAVLEASACGVPVITSSVGGLPEVTVNGVTGKIVPAEDVDALADAILLLARDESLRKEMGENGREFVKEHYEWSACVDRMEEVYKNILQGVDIHK
ncbi:glycosyltransferase [bacterium]|nr:glycosyltransferase [bacterium]